MNYINIEPKEIITSATKMKIDVVSLDLHNSAILRITLLDSNLKIVQTNMLILSGEDYEAWQTDDNLVNLICEKYNYQLS
ncbi:MAG: hypothetical protein ACOVOV_00360 [Dolichospermum sp.]